MSVKNLFKTAGLIAVITILSKIAGFARDVFIAQEYGATLVSDAYFYAYQIPALALILLGGLGGPFHTATIAVFSKAISDITKKPEEQVQKVLNTFITATGIGFALLSVLVFFFSDSIISAIASGASEHLKELASMQLKIMSPIILIGGLIGIFYGISNVYKEFVITSLSPTVASLAIIASLFLFNGDTTGVVLAWATLAGAVGQLLIQLPVFFKTGFRYLPSVDFKSEKIAKVGEILFPAMVATTIGQINIYVDMFFASRLEPGAWSAIGYANRLFQFPVGIIITAMLVPLFPMFSSFVGKKDWGSLKHYFHQGLGSLWFMAFPIFAFIVIFAQDAIRLVFQRGEFDANATLMVSSALMFLSISIIPYVARDSITRIFYAFDDSKTPFYVATFSIAVKVLMNSLLVDKMGIGGITLSTTIVTFVNFALLAYLIRAKISLGFNEMIKPLGKVVLATVLMSAAGLAAKFYMDGIMNESTILFGLKIVAYGAICVTAYMLASYVLKIDYARQLVGKIRGVVFAKDKETVSS